MAHDILNNPSTPLRVTNECGLGLARLTPARPMSGWLVGQARLACESPVIGGGPDRIHKTTTPLSPPCKEGKPVISLYQEGCSRGHEGLHWRIPTEDLSRLFGTKDGVCQEQCYRPLVVLSAATKPRRDSSGAI